MGPDLVPLNPAALGSPMTTPPVVRPLAVLVKFDEADSALLRQAVAVCKDKGFSMTPTQLAREGARRWASEVVRGGSPKSSD